MAAVVVGTVVVGRSLVVEGVCHVGVVVLVGYDAGMVGVGVDRVGVESDPIPSICASSMAAPTPPATSAGAAACRARDSGSGESAADIGRLGTVTDPSSRT